jgi:hypothetical protein
VHTIFPIACDGRIPPTFFFRIALAVLGCFPGLSISTKIAVGFFLKEIEIALKL